MVDLSTQPASVGEWMKEGVERFLAEHPAQVPTSISLYSSPQNGWVSLCVDMSSDLGWPNTNCPDYTYPEYSLLECPQWQTEYETDAPMIKRHDGVVVRFRHEQGDDVINRPYFDFLMRVSNDYYHRDQTVFRPIWYGVQILDSKLYSFGRVYQFPKT